jgi:hypothetical protein
VESAQGSDALRSTRRTRKTREWQVAYVASAH